MRNNSNENSCSGTEELLGWLKRTYGETWEKTTWAHLITEEDASGFLPIDSFMIVGSIKKLDLLEGGWTWKVTGDSWMHGQEEVHGCCACNRNQFTGPGSHIMLGCVKGFTLQKTVPKRAHSYHAWLTHPFTHAGYKSSGIKHVSAHAADLSRLLRTTAVTHVGYPVLPFFPGGTATQSRGRTHTCQMGGGLGTAGHYHVFGKEMC